MTEAEWLACEDPNRLLKWLQKSKRHRPPRRKLLLFAAGCAGRVAALHGDPISLHCLQLAEDLADGKSDGAEQLACRGQARTLDNVKHNNVSTGVMRIFAPESWASSEGGARGVAGYAAHVSPAGEPATQCLLLRDVLGNPFRPVTLNPTWLTSTVVSLASGIYEDRAFDRMPILADALQDAGCDNADILNHCRSDGPHVRGCWVVDLMLGKS